VHDSWNADTLLHRYCRYSLCTYLASLSLKAHKFLFLHRFVSSNWSRKTGHILNPHCTLHQEKERSLRKGNLCKCWMSMNNSQIIEYSEYNVNTLTYYVLHCTSLYFYLLLMSQLRIDCPWPLGIKRFQSSAPLSRLPILSALLWTWVWPSKPWSSGSIWTKSSTESSTGEGLKTIFSGSKKKRYKNNSN